MLMRAADGPVNRRRMLWGAAWFAGGVATGVPAGAIPAIATSSPSASIPAPKVLQGTVLADPPPSGTDVSVKIGEAVQRVAYQVPYVPVPGDVVDVTILEAGAGKQIARILGALSGRAGNLVVNGDFARIPTVKSLTPPYMWTHYKAAGSQAKAVGAYIVPEFGKPMMYVASWPENSGDHYAVSAAFPVRPGEVIKVDAAFSAELVRQITLAVELRVSWWADPAANYPAKPLADNVLMAVDVTVDGKWPLEGQATAPAGAAAARVAIRAKHSGEQDCQYTLYIGHVYAGR